AGNNRAEANPEDDSASAWNCGRLDDRRARSTGHVRSTSRVPALQPIEPLKDRQSVLGRRAGRHCGHQEPSRFLGIAAVEGGNPLLQELIGFTLTFGKRASRAFDVRAGTRVAAIEEQSTGPD